MNVTSTGRFPRSARLLTPAQFQRVFEGGARTATRCFAAHVLHHDEPARLGIAVSRKVDKRAVGRNRIKRQIRESFRATRATLPACDIVVIGRRSAADADNAALRAELVTLWRRIASLKPAAAAGTMPAAAADPVAEPTAAAPAASRRSQSS